MCYNSVKNPGSNFSVKEITKIPCYTGIIVWCIHNQSVKLHQLVLLFLSQSFNQVFAES